MVISPDEFGGDVPFVEAGAGGHQRLFPPFPRLTRLALRLDELPKRGPEILLYEELARLRGLPPRQKHLARVRPLFEILAFFRVHRRRLVLDGVAAGEIDGRRQDVFQAHGTELGQHQDQGAGNARRGSRQGAVGRRKAHSPIPEELRPQMGNWVYGCDVCQTVCPFNRFVVETRESAFRAADLDRAAPPLVDLLALDEAGFRQRFAGTPIQRIGRARLVRNACVAAGNGRGPAALPLLERLAARDESALVREHAAWALGQF
jgi:hypothetical protein